MYATPRGQKNGPRKDNDIAKLKTQKEELQSQLEEAMICWLRFPARHGGTPIAVDFIIFYNGNSHENG